MNSKYTKPLAVFSPSLFDDRFFNNFFSRSVGFSDRFEEMLQNIDNVFSLESFGSNPSVGSSTSYPPYNLVKINDNKYQVSVAVAGFPEKDITVEVKENVLLIKGKVESKKEGNELKEEPQYLVRGLAGRQFERRFMLEDYIEVDSATLENGILSITLTRNTPEESKVKVIPITKV